MSTTAIFSGNSRFAVDFSQIIERSVSIASLPLKQLQQQKVQLNDQSTALTSLDSKFSALQAAIAKLSSKVGVEARSASLDEPTVATVTTGADSLPGQYSLEVLNVGSRAVALSVDGRPKVTNPSTETISSDPSLTLTVAGTNYTISNGINNLAALAAQINAAQAGVQATVINVGSSSSPDYRLSVLATKLGEVSVQLSDGSGVLLNTITSGSLAAYRVNGAPSTPIQSDTRNVTLAPGLTASIQKAGTTNITVNQVGSDIETAISELVTAFNAAVDETDKHRGSAQGALTGQSLVSNLAQTLRRVGGYSAGGGAIDSLAALGVTFDQTGHLLFSKSTFQQRAAQNPDDLASFLGTATQDGFLKFATDALASIEDASQGDLASAINLVKKQVTAQDLLINTAQDRVRLLQDTLATQMARADALIASLEQQVTYMTNLFQAMKDSKQ